MRKGSFNKIIMIRDVLQISAYKSIQHLCIMARTACKTDAETASAILDVVDYLAGLAAQPDDRTDAFRRALEGYSEIVPACKEALRIFDQ